MDTTTGSIGSSLLWCLAGAAVLGVAGFFFFRKKGLKKILDFSMLRQLVTLPMPRQVDEITMREIIAWFRQPEIRDMLGSNPELLAVAVLDRHADYIEVALCLFNSASQKIEKIELLSAPKMDENTISHFGDKTMIVLK